MKALFDIAGRLVLVMVLVMAVLIGALGGDSLFDSSGYAEASLSKAKFVGFMGVDYSSDLGNTTGTTTAVDLVRQIPDEINCFFSVQNASGVIVANTATAVIQTSYQGADWDTFATVTVAASTVTGYRNTGGASGSAVPWGDQWRVNISAIQNANSSYVTGQCVFE